jgi:hypothetical protein
MTPTFAPESNRDFKVSGWMYSGRSRRIIKTSCASFKAKTSTSGTPNRRTTAVIKNISGVQQGLRYSNPMFKSYAIDNFQGRHVQRESVFISGSGGNILEEVLLQPDTEVVLRQQFYYPPRGSEARHCTDGATWCCVQQH